MRVGILGGGRWGQALGRLIMAAGHEPYIAWRDVKPPHILPSTDDPPKVTAACDLILVATSAAELRNAIQQAKPGPGNRVVVAGRGLEPERGAWLADVVQQESDCLRVGALAGPAPVDEILSGGLCAGVVASPFSEVRRLTQEALHSSRYRVYETPDLAGIQLAGAMVPVLGALLGLAANLQGSGVGLHATVLSRGLAEARRLASTMGADEATFSGLAGVGDLVAVQSRAGHASFEAGAALAKGDLTPRSPFAAARALLTVADRLKVEMPLTQGLVWVADGVPAVDMVHRLMTRAATRE